MAAAPISERLGIAHSSRIDKYHLSKNAVFIGIYCKFIRNRFLNIHQKPLLKYLLDTN